MDQELGLPPGQPGTALVGAPGSPGRYAGAIGVIRGEADFDRLRPGEVLVCW